MEQVSTQTGSTESAYTEGYNRGIEMGSNLVKLATHVAHSTIDVVNEGVKSIDEILNESEQKTVAVSSKIGEVIDEGVKSFEKTLNECEQTVESVYTEGLSKSADFVTTTRAKVGEAVEHSVKLAESSINDSYTHSVNTATDAGTKVAEMSGQVADTAFSTATKGVNSAQNVLKQTEENYRGSFNKGMDIATTVGTKAAEIAGEVVGGTMHVAEEMWSLVNETVACDRTEESLRSKVE